MIAQKENLFWEGRQGVGQSNPENQKFVNFFFFNIFSNIFGYDLIELLY